MKGCNLLTVWLWNRNMEHGTFIAQTDCGAQDDDKTNTLYLYCFICDPNEIRNLFIRTGILQLLAPLNRILYHIEHFIHFTLSHNCDEFRLVYLFIAKSTKCVFLWVLNIFLEIIYVWTTRRLKLCDLGTLFLIMRILFQIFEQVRLVSWIDRGRRDLSRVNFTDMNFVNNTCCQVSFFDKSER
jgi:hypothetical protein